MCGIVGIYSKKYNNVDTLLKTLELLQHRGKDSFGIGYIKSDNETKHFNYNQKGLISNSTILRNNNLINIKIKMGIGHVKYTTSDKINDSTIQPLSYSDEKNKILLVHNGNIPNTPYYDSQYILDFLSRNINENFKTRLIKLMNTIEVSYNLLIIYNDILYIVKDRYGIRPLNISNDRNNYYICSETISLSNLNINKKNIREIEPGSIIEIKNNTLNTVYKHPGSIPKCCVFEYLYFMKPYSIINNTYIYQVRESLGILLAKKETLPDKDYIVIGIPDSGISSAMSYSRFLNYDYKQLIKKNIDSSRTFILSNNNKRIEACNKKFVYEKQNLKGKKIILIDDTIVRGNVIKSIIKNLKSIGVNEIHIRIPSPPIINKCQLGIAIQSKQNLLMYNKSIVNVRDELDINSLDFLTVEELNIVLPEIFYKEYFLEKDTIFKSY